MPETKTDTVPGLGFKDKEKALETIKNLEGRDPEYQKLAIKGLIGRAKRTLTLTKDEEKLQNINEAMSTFEEWLKNFEKHNLSKENRSYLPLSTITTMFTLKDKYDIEDKKAESFLEAYKSVKGDYKNLRTVSSGKNNEPSWDIVRNAELKKLLKEVDEKSPELWDDELPTKSHFELILWAYSPDASRIKKNISKIEEKLGKNKDDDDDDDIDMKADDKSENEKNEEEEEKRTTKRKSDDSSSSDEESPAKKKKRN